MPWTIYDINLTSPRKNLIKYVVVPFSDRLKDNAGLFEQVALHRSPTDSPELIKLYLQVLPKPRRIIISQSFGVAKRLPVEMRCSVCCLQNRIRVQYSFFELTNPRSSSNNSEVLANLEPSNSTCLHHDLCRLCLSCSAFARHNQRLTFLVTDLLLETYFSIILWTCGPHLRLRIHEALGGIRQIQIYRRFCTSGSFSFC